MAAKIIVIIGPTCSGKTELSLKLAQKLNSEIISADSRQCFKFMDIGTAKPTVAEQQSVRHHFIDTFSPNESFSAGEFENQALKIILNLIDNNKTPVVVGGSGLYIDALINGIADMGKVDIQLRNKLLYDLDNYGVEFLYNQLKVVDPESAEKYPVNDWRRILRALEVFFSQGKKIWELQEEHTRPNNLEFKLLGLNWEREILYKNIENRVDIMIKNGLIDEIKNILKLGFDPALNSLNTVGYREIIEYLDGFITLERAIELIKRNTRRYAKKQITWFKRYEAEWYNIKNRSETTQICDNIYNNFLLDNSNAHR